MTNLEHYLKDILYYEESIAISKKTETFEYCSELCCKDCLFYDGDDENRTCSRYILSWMFEEYKPPISNLEYDILDYLYNNTKFRYLARDDGKWLFAYYEPPVKGTEFWGGGENYGSLEVFNDIFDFVRWEDAKPTSIKEILDKREKERNDSEVIDDGNN